MDLIRNTGASLIIAVDLLAIKLDLDYDDDSLVL
jgi:hypothetical protein